jgi:hypothetical protein
VFRRDKAIARNDKRRQDGVHIQALTISLAKSIPKEAACIVTSREAKSRDVQPEEPEHKLALALVAAPSLPDNTTVCKAKAYGLTWERQTYRNLEHIQEELRRPYDY